ncbi:bifunctional DNA-formamidopyrimidine glycosylase/DNA-(apurinic or apyrimidinic site) lyase [Commensalibacter oyaizuii]|uniref:Formamidopyrimidine-DNA glycosylase n=1 Tax=Commensalibacter oyaizuii TaxID=3043873 RepID=A0ABT6PZL8_9PROT|nr:bifunctional DNA-formamidopyrimidine glycosylase/DNA-(apurinic or apyrimidinic site) lyase [Commensalibacter sp. TBRC 16381]MDI2090300.1 bifunctional DNA-formamidopyrimidine glycosylase/DNA-(apurinic or apyrimidinic site) lyase [Commensalibacter sp. TBRC 16381]
MPELPEVETIKRGLEQSLINQTIVSVKCHRDHLRIPIPKNLDSVLMNAQIINFTRRGKYILIHLNNQQTILIHLGMSGKMIVRPHNSSYILQKHEHLTVLTKEGQCLSYIDPRRFGMIDIFPSNQTHRLLVRMGPEPIIPKTKYSQFSSYLYNQLQKKKQSIKSSLLDQHLIAGLGNIYVCEALFLAEISPLRPSNSITLEETFHIVKAIQTILTKAIKAGGSSMRDYVHSDGKRGYFQMQWNVYGKEKENCSKCLTKGKKTLIKRTTQAGRSSFYCDTCQR